MRAQVVQEQDVANFDGWVSDELDIDVEDGRVDRAFDRESGGRSRQPDGTIAVCNRLRLGQSWRQGAGRFTQRRSQVRTKARWR